MLSEGKMQVSRTAPHAGHSNPAVFAGPSAQAPILKEAILLMSILTFKAAQIHVEAQETA